MYNNSSISAHLCWYGILYLLKIMTQKMPVLSSRWLCSLWLCFTVADAAGMNEVICRGIEECVSLFNPSEMASCSRFHCCPVCPWVHLTVKHSWPSILAHQTGTERGWLVWQCERAGTTVPMWDGYQLPQWTVGAQDICQAGYHRPKHRPLPHLLIVITFEVDRLWIIIINSLKYFSAVCISYVFGL